MQATTQHNSTPDGIELQDRDITLLRGLFESRLMTLHHAAALYFEGRAEAAKKRVQKLKAAGLVGERPRRAYDPSVLFLTRKAFAVLSDRGILNDYPRLGWGSLEKRARVSELTLRHELAVMDVKAGVMAAIAQAPCLSVAEFSTWPLLFQFRASHGNRRDILVKPDGYLRIHEQKGTGDLFEHTFFWEVDRSTEPQETLAQRAACYADYYRRGGLAMRHGRRTEEFKDFPFRVLMVFRNEERRNNTAERLLLNRPPVLTQIWLSTFAEVIANPFGAIWIRPADYRTATAGTPYDPKLRGQLEVYRRQPERETLVEETLKKQALIV